VAILAFWRLLGFVHKFVGVIGYLLAENCVFLACFALNSLSLLITLHISKPGALHGHLRTMDFRNLLTCPPLPHIRPVPSFDVSLVCSYCLNALVSLWLSCEGRLLVGVGGVRCVTYFKDFKF